LHRPEVKASRIRSAERSSVDLISDDCDGFISDFRVFEIVAAGVNCRDGSWGEIVIPVTR
jgi:hypothetical protein